MATWIFETDFVRRKHDFPCLFLIVAELDNLAIWEGELFLFISWFLNRVGNNRTEFLFDVSYYFELSTCIHIKANLPQKISEVIGDISSSEIYSFTRMCERVSFIDRDDMSDSIARVQNNTCRLSSCKST